MLVVSLGCSWRSGAWLDPKIQNAAEVAAIICAGVINEVKHHPVSPLINKLGTEGPELIEPLASMSSG